MRAAFPVLLVVLVSACAQKELVIRKERAPRRVESDRSSLTEDRRGMQARVEPPKPAGQCEVGQVKACGGASPFADGRPLMMHCRRDWTGVLRFSREECSTPLVLANADEPVQFTRPTGSFAIGPYAKTEWVSAKTPWLALDADGSGCIEGQAELFGPPENARDDEALNGFGKLARLDENHDGKIDERDPAFGKLVLWSDANQDRKCTSNEITRLADYGIVSLDLNATRPAFRPFGSFEGERASVDAKGKHLRLVDVYLSPID